mmetsp:Transcript_34910/g.87861  ORF Transcript_34910/g.87861 Transcript_34910/m.87861 type:complete len:1239 (-) Transcript_34910:64-3780(-)|eukprot:CAMPEP_0174235670 /NCGR_PEP_ID=MMETSP0417-20130205/5028_1 /TAXON_ID=242541 /ORGANISM="Mayorella sp, Strain BSH-02190019" /LENGTH=1238 /DNA_ID=CAMNT_0015314211 /DNA_START=186 /DNA_END=3902 /DNA_ORIENTATION=-
MARFQILFVVGCVLLALCCSTASAASISPNLNDLGLWSYTALKNGGQTHSSPALMRTSSGDPNIADLTLVWEGGLGAGAAAFSWFTGAHFTISPQESPAVLFGYQYQVAKQPTWAALDRLEVDPGVAVEIDDCLCWYQDSGASFSEETFVARTGSVPLSDLASVTNWAAIRGDNGTCDHVCVPTLGALNGNAPLKMWAGFRAAAQFYPGAQGSGTIPFQVAALRFNVDMSTGTGSLSSVADVHGAYDFNLPRVWNDNSGNGNAPFDEEPARARCFERTADGVVTPGITCDTLEREIIESGNSTSGDYAVSPRAQFLLPINLSPATVLGATISANVFIEANCGAETGAIARSAGNADRGFGVGPTPNGEEGCQLWAWSGMGPVLGPILELNQWYSVVFTSTSGHVTLVVDGEVYSASLSGNSTSNANQDQQATSAVIVGSDAFAFAGGLIDNLYVAASEASLSAQFCVSELGIAACSTFYSQQPVFGADHGRFYRSHLVPRATRIYDSDEDRTYAFLGNSVDGGFLLFDLSANTIAEGFYRYETNWHAAWEIQALGYPLDAPTVISHESAERKLSTVIFGENGFQLAASLNGDAIAPNGNSMWKNLQDFSQQNSLRGETLFPVLSAVGNDAGSRAAIALSGEVVGKIARGETPGSLQFTSALPPSNLQSRVEKQFDDALVPVSNTSSNSFVEYGDVEIGAIPSVDSPVDDTTFSSMRVELTSNWLARPSLLDNFRNRYLYGYSYQSDASMRDLTANSVYIEGWDEQSKIVDPYVTGLYDARNRTIKFASWPNQAYDVKFANDLEFAFRWVAMQLNGWSLDEATASSQAGTVCQIADALWVRDASIDSIPSYWWTFYGSLFTPGMNQPQIAARVAAIRGVYNLDAEFSSTSRVSCATFWNKLVGQYATANVTQAWLGDFDGDIPAELGMVWTIEALAAADPIALPKQVVRQVTHAKISKEVRAEHARQITDDPDARELARWTGSRFAFLLEFTVQPNNRSEVRPSAGDADTVAFQSYPLFTDLKVYNADNERFYTSKFVLALAKADITFNNTELEAYANLLAAGDVTALRQPTLFVSNITEASQDMQTLFEDWDLMANMAERLNGIWTTSDAARASIRDNTADVYLMGSPEYRNAHAIVLAAQTSPFDWPLQGIDVDSFNFPKLILSRQRPEFFVARTEKLDEWYSAMYNSGDDNPQPVNYLPARNDNPSIEYRLENSAGALTAGLSLMVVCLVAVFGLY